MQAGDLHEIVDPRLQSDYSVESMWKVVEVAMTSVEPKGGHRPDMQEVVQELREAVAMEEQRCANQLGTAWQGRSSSASEIRSDFSTHSTSHTSGGSSGYSQPLAR